jgi:hypothetical protein
MKTINDLGITFALKQKGFKTMYESTDEILRDFPNVSKRELAKVERMLAIERVVGVVEHCRSNFEQPMFIQVYGNESFIEV